MEKELKTLKRIRAHNARLAYQCEQDLKRQRLFLIGGIREIKFTLPFKKKGFAPVI